MPRPCTVCRHDERALIDAALVSGTPARQLAARYGLSDDSVSRHNAAHLPVRLVQAAAAGEAAQADDLLAEVRKRTDRVARLADVAEGLIRRAYEAGDLRTAAAAVNAATGASREVRGCLELLAKLRGELDERPQVNIVLSPQWHLVRAALLEALLPYPQARAAVASRLMSLEVA